MKLNSQTGWLEGARLLPSPNYDDRPVGEVVDLLVVHGISLPPGKFGGPYIDALFTNTLNDNEHPFFKEIAGLRVSAHVLIRRDGEVVQYVPFTKRAWHAGASSFAGRERCNDFSIGIELEGCDDLPYESVQYQSLAELTRLLMLEFPALTTERIAGHCDIAPGRKSDPGSCFDWSYFRSLLVREGRMRIGIDLGGTKIEAIALADDGHELLRERIVSPRGSYEATLRAVADLVSRVERKTGETGRVGIGTPGAISPATGLLKNSNSVWLNGKPLQRDLEALLGRPIHIANDADCFALSEAVDGAAAGASSVFGVILGTGVGGGIVINGQLVRGPNAIAGEWGHNPLPWPRWDEMPGPHCYCGKRGCIETFLSGPALSRDHYDLTRKRLTARELAAQCDGAHPLAEQTLARYEDRLARALASVINILDPEVIVLGGGVSNIRSLYQRVPKLWGQYVFSDVVNTHLLPASHGDSSGVRGAAWLWPLTR